MRIEDRELKQLRGKEIALVKVAWGGPAGGNVTWELESQMKESYPEIEMSGRGRDDAAIAEALGMLAGVLGGNPNVVGMGAARQTE
ncbi:hypothetical protein KIW84_050976 [Lathyrus oleraceus]|uniref:Uncharacterized protein n=1 Tax=Pisum sativum TaxID=3888 RepID=A0A9D4WL69_PEA|nr:hypothetical protein KIW84_050976 [Pisum sativum]